jgi:ATP-binding cassette, subfamily B, bacterial PglK
MDKSIIKPKLSKLLFHLWCHLDKRRHFQFGLVFCFMLLSALADVVSMGAVLPFIGVLVAPEQVFSHPLMIYVTQFFGINSAKELVLPLTVAFAFTAVATGAIRILLLWCSVRLSVATGADLSIDVYRRTLFQPYNIHLARNSSDVISGMTGKVNSVVSMVLIPFLTLLSSTLLLVAVASTLFVIDPMLATVATLGFGTVYGSITFLVRLRLIRNSQLIADEQTHVIKALQEGLGGIRDVLLDGTQNIYSNIYRKADYPLRRAQGNNVFIVGSPRFAMETLGIVMIVVLAYILSLQDGGIASALPLLGVLAFGAQRLLPAMQQCYSAWSTITGNQASLVDTLELLDQPVPLDKKESILEPLLFCENICFDKVRFQYTDGGPWVLDGINLIIPKGARVGIVGSTGSGKSTLLDLLMGLIEPTEGELSVDGQNIKGKNLRAWQKNISHVPQSIFLTDATITENIAFGVPSEDIDYMRVKEVACLAQISEYIKSSKEGFHTMVGERGVRLSGGQRQRIGIARALYKKSSILVFDEATSALDNATEQMVMNAVEGIYREITIFFIAHRLSTVRDCDFIVEMNNGKTVAQGTYDELLKSSTSFLNMVNAI